MILKIVKLFYNKMNNFLQYDEDGNINFKDYDSSCSD